MMRMNLTDTRRPGGLPFGADRSRRNPFERWPMSREEVAWPKRPYQNR